MKKTRLLLTTCLLLVLSFALVKGQSQNVSLNGNWQFIADSTSNYVSGIPADKSLQVQVPHTWNVMKGLEDYLGKCWYERTIEAPQSWKGKAVRLHFKAVYHDAWVYLNGKLIGKHIGAGYTPFSYDISEYLTYGKDNSLVVMADNSFSDENMPYMRKFDWSADGGIYRDVYLRISDRPSISYVHVTPKLQLTDSTGRANINIRLFEENINNAKFQIKIAEKRSGKVIADLSPTLKKNADGKFSYDVDFDRVTPWHFDNPFLYTFDVKVMKSNVVSDTKDGHFGFRTFEAKGHHLLLNGEAVRLPGIEYMAGSNPAFGMAEPKAYIDSVVTMMKNMNIVLTRFHWQQDEEMLNLMDEYGILVMAEISWWQQPEKLSPKLLNAAKRNVEEMIEDEYNHPCIVAWGLSNEVPDNRESVKPLAELAYKLDQSRMINVITNRLDRQLANNVSLEYDLPTWNEYTGTWNAKTRDELPGKLNTIKPVLKGRPLLITELGRCEPTFTGGDAKRIDDMIYHIEEYCKHDYIAGYIYFCVNDYRTQMGEEGYGVNRIRRHGVADMALKPKPSYYQLQSMANPIEISKINIAAKEHSTTEQVNVLEASGRYSEIAREVYVKLSVKNSIPSYIIRGYYLKYHNDKGTELTIELPELNPGEDYELIIPDMASHYNLRIYRPTGFEVTRY